MIHTFIKHPETKKSIFDLMIENNWFDENNFDKNIRFLNIYIANYQNVSLLESAIAKENMSVIMYILENMTLADRNKYKFKNECLNEAYKVQNIGIMEMLLKVFNYSSTNLIKVHNSMCTCASQELKDYFCKKIEEFELNDQYFSQSKY
jgi:hypothetical protein